MKFLTVYDYDYESCQDPRRASRTDIRADTVVRMFNNGNDVFPTRVIAEAGGRLEAYMSKEALDELKAILEADDANSYP